MSITDVLAAFAAKHDTDGSFPTEGIAAVHEAGLLTGLGHDASTIAHALLDLGKGDPSVALISAMTIFIHARQARTPHWPTDLYQQILAESVATPTLLNHARVEPSLGSPARGGLPDTIARRTSTGWSISGEKRFVTGIDGLAYVLAWARTDESQPRVGTFVVPTLLEGMEVIRTWDQLGLRASGSHDVCLANVEIPAEYVLGIGPANESAQQNNLALGSEVLLPSAIYLGVARAAQDYFHTFANERIPANLGRPVATTERFQLAAGEIAVLLDTAERLLFDTLQTQDLSPEYPLAARVQINRNVQTAVALAVKLLGNPGLSRAAPLERHYRDVHSTSIHAPQEDTALAAIGRANLRR